MKDAPALLDLLPRERQRALRRGYALRLSVIGILLATVLIVLAGIFLVPTYVFLNSTFHADEMRLAAINTTLSSTNDSALSTRLAALSENAQSVISLSKNTSVSGLMQSVLAVPHIGISLASFTYTPRVGQDPATLVVSGTSQTRDLLRQYQLALSAAPFATSADLPVSTYATQTDLPFTITITLAP